MGETLRSGFLRRVEVGKGGWQGSHGCRDHHGGPSSLPLAQSGWSSAGLWREIWKPNPVPPPHLSLALGEAFFCAWLGPTLRPSHPRPRAMFLGPKTAAHKKSSGANKSPFHCPDPLLLAKASSVTLGAHPHELVRHDLCSSKEDGDQVRDVVHNSNG